VPAGTCKLWDDKPCFMPNAKPNVKRSPRRSLHKPKSKAQAPRPTFGLCSPLRGDKPWVWFFEKGPKRTLFMPLPPKQMQRCHPVGAYTSRTVGHRVRRPHMATRIPRGRPRGSPQREVCADCWVRAFRRSRRGDPCGRPNRGRLVYGRL
jgi:hypothetical protein